MPPRSNEVSAMLRMAEFGDVISAARNRFSNVLLSRNEQAYRADCSKCSGGEAFSLWGK